MDVEYGVGVTTCVDKTCANIHKESDSRSSEILQVTAIQCLATTKISKANKALTIIVPHFDLLKLSSNLAVKVCIALELVNYDYFFN